MRSSIAVWFAALALVVVLTSAARVRAEGTAFEIRAENGQFHPAELLVPAGAPFEVHVTSAERAPIEFESFELHRERVVQPGETIKVNMPALSAGTYKFFDDFHRTTPEGAIVVK